LFKCGPFVTRPVGGFNACPGKITWHRFLFVPVRQCTWRGLTRVRKISGITTNRSNERTKIEGIGLL